MKVIASINGSITSESAAVYALEYAKAHNLTLVLHHSPNREDDRDAVGHSMKAIGAIAAENGVATEELILKGGAAALARYARENMVDMLFCASRVKRRFFVPSFSDQLLHASPGVDVGVVRIVHVKSTLGLTSLLLPIMATRLSVRKFAFFAALLKAYGAEGTLLSINIADRRTQARFTTARTKHFFRGINHRLAHYRKLGELMEVNLRIKHLIGENERHELLNYLGSGESDLMIIGAQRLSFFSRILGERPIERILRETSVNTIAYYSGDEL